jgi:hypothetical protein
MRLVGTLHVLVSGSLIEREPSRWEKLKRGLGASVDLSTDQVKVELEATAVVDGVRRGLAQLGVTNALALVIDETVVFQDAHGKADDLGDLMLAMADHASVFGRGFNELRFAAEHEESGIHMVIEARARTVHKADQPAAVVSIAGRLKALEPRPGESPDAYRARVEPLVKDTVAFEVARVQFQTFVSRLQEALRATMINAVVEEVRAEARLVKSTPKDLDRPPVRDPAHPGYDPYLMYYPSPMGSLLDAMMITSFMSMMHPPMFHVMTPMGASLGNVQEAASAGDGGDRDEGGNDNDGDTADTGNDSGGDSGDDGGGFDFFGDD